ncbi:S41 family peptidase [Chitinophaga sp.]|uniref:S41 family peptidase n=1 Tax=Chitinophaga sp. TaxID=1869181 RepID=UPI0031D2178C
MRKLFFCVLLSMSATSLYAQKTLFDTVFTLVKTKSVYAQHVNWDSLTPLVYQKMDVTKADSVAAVLEAFGPLMQALKDMHSSMSWKDKVNGNPDAWAFVDSKITPEMRDAANKGYSRLRTAMLPGGYGYISIPAAGIKPTEDMQAAIEKMSAIAQGISDSLCVLQTKSLKGLIIDLRLNGGGSSPALIGGLSPVLDNGLCFAFAKKNNDREEMRLKDGNLFYDTLQIIKLKKTCPLKKAVKVAVLISGYTTSAGEHAAIALKGSHRARFFGSPTRGQISGNETIFIRKDVTLSLSTAWAEDNAGRRYMVDVAPDVVVPDGADFEHLDNDKSVQAAIRWFTTGK